MSKKIISFLLNIFLTFNITINSTKSVNNSVTVSYNFNETKKYDHKKSKKYFFTNDTYDFIGSIFLLLSTLTFFIYKNNQNSYNNNIKIVKSYGIFTKKTSTSTSTSKSTLSGGIKNLGNTCYFNSAIQLLRNCFENNKSCFNKKPQTLTKNIKLIHKSSDLVYINNNIENLLREIMFFINNQKLNLENNYFINPFKNIINYVNSIITNEKYKFDYHKQNDSRELIFKILDFLNVPFSNSSISSSHINKFKDFNKVLMIDLFNINDKIKKSEILNTSNDNEVYKILEDSNLGESYIKDSDIFLVSISREKYKKEGNNIKCIRQIDISHDIKLDEITLNIDGNIIKYYLSSFICFSGSFNINGSCGHYFTYRKIDDLWFEFNDLYVRKVDQSVVYDALSKKANLLYFQKVV